jgi:outer membrane protein
MVTFLSDALVLANGKVRLQLAEGRYRAGIGNIIALSDAQVVLTAGSTQVVSVAFRLATARTRLIEALGRGAS